MKADIFFCKDFPLLSSCHWNCMYKKKVNVQLHRSIPPMETCDMWWNSSPY